jgi:hypothetical protein
MNDKPIICWVIALKAEAKPIIAYFKMSRINHFSGFDIFGDRERNNLLIISGVGQSNSTWATQLLREENNAMAWAGFINLGIAGHGTANNGTLFLVDKITSRDSSECIYPSVVIAKNMPRAELITSDCPETDYNSNTLFDMEGYGFFQAASKQSSKELVLLLKIVSDGPGTSLESLTAKKVSSLIFQNIDSIIAVSEKLRSISDFEARRLSRPNICCEILNKWHFTFSQEHQLNFLVRRWSAAFPNRLLFNEINKCSDSKQILYFLKYSLDNNKVDWESLW